MPQALRQIKRALGITVDVDIERDYRDDIRSLKKDVEFATKQLIKKEMEREGVAIKV
jgi:hypothetical protein